MEFHELHSAGDIVELVREVGFLPFFANGVRGFSVEEHCPPDLWFSEDAEGPWEWKGPAARSGECLYGKFFGGKAGFVSLEWFPDFANYRRDGYDFDARYDDGLASHKDKVVYNTVAEHGALLSKELKRLCDYRKGGSKGFETVITRLQMQSYINISDFVYMKDKFGRTYGWGVAKYSTPEETLGWLLEGTVRENLIYNTPGVTDERLDTVCRAVGLHHFVETLPDGYDTVLNDSVSLSEGQKQQLTIARAMIKDAPLLILDEATSSVDTRTELVIQEAMDKLTENRTSFVIAHRLSTIRNADIILVMRDGDIVEQGNHESLLAQNGFYAELYNSQFENVG